MVFSDLMQLAELLVFTEVTQLLFKTDNKQLGTC